MKANVFSKKSRNGGGWVWLYKQGTIEEISVKDFRENDSMNTGVTESSHPQLN